jgi:hypothetical protein
MTDDSPTITPGVSRLGALTGLVGIVCYVVGTLLPGSAPKPDAATVTIVSWLGDHRSSLLFGYALEIIALALLVCFLGQLRTALAATGPHAVPVASAMFGAWVVLLTLVAASLLPVIALTWWGTPAGDPSLVRLAYDMETVGGYSVTATVAMVAVGAPSWIIWRSGVLPRALAVLGAIEIAVNVVELVGLSSRHGALAGGWFEGIGPLVWALWVAATSVCLALRVSGRDGVRSTGAPSPPTPLPTPPPTPARPA